LDLKKTEIRLKILAFLQNSNKAISQPDLEKEFVKSADRVTLYRILSAFEQKGIIHKIIDLGGVARYAVCNHDVCSENHHHDNHVHFSCSSCGDVLCIESIPIPKIELPKDLIQNKITLSIEGICRKCNK
jgi:Fur family ferric uptake transcriptional regulator